MSEIQEEGSLEHSSFCFTNLSKTIFLQFERRRVGKRHSFHFGHELFQ